MATKFEIRAMAKQRPKHMRALRKSKHIQRWLLRNPWIRPISAFNVAAIKIQKAFRGFYCRRKLANRLKPRKISPKRSQLNKYLTFMDLCKAGAARKPPWLESGYSVWCIVKIQAFARMHRFRWQHKMRKRVVNQIAAIVLQTAWRNSPMWRVVLAIRKARYAERCDVQVESRRIQNCWRAFSNRRVYRYLKDLVLVKFKGAPADLLRCIVPGEVDLFDKAAGVHVRFRLGGTVFPPKILFKVFTHRALCDVNAFAPRAYKDEKKMEPAQVHCHMGALPMRRAQKTSIRVGGRYFDTLVTTNTMNGEGWYRREDRNEWRPIACQIIDDNFVPEWLQHVNKPPAPRPFHYSSLHRRVDLLKHRKRRKREWLMKAYRLAAGDDLLQSEGGGGQGAARTMSRETIDDEADVGEGPLRLPRRQGQEGGLFPHGRRTHVGHSRGAPGGGGDGDNMSQATSQQERSVQLSESTGSAGAAHSDATSQHSEDSRQKIKLLTGRLRDERDLLLAPDADDSVPGIGISRSLTKVDVAYRSPPKHAYVQGLTMEGGKGQFEVAERYEETGALRKNPMGTTGKGGKKARSGVLPPLGASGGAGAGAASRSNKLSVFRDRNSQAALASKREAELDVYRRALDAPDEDLVKWGLTLDFEAYSNSWACLASSMPSDFDYFGVVAAGAGGSQKV